MKLTKTTLCGALALAATVGAASPVEAGIPRLVSLQGELGDASAQPITGAVNITFRVYDVGTGGTPLWQETQSVTVDEGVYNVLLGSVTLLDLPFDTDYWLGIEVGADGEMVPRLRMASSPYAYKAGSAASADVAADADTVDGMHATDFLDKATYDVDDNGKADAAETADTATTAGDADTLDGKHAGDFDMPPVALLTAAETSGYFADSVEMAFDASASYDPEGGALEFAWDLLGDGQFSAFASSTTSSYTYPPVSRPYLAAVRVRDAAGRVTENKALVRGVAVAGRIIDGTVEGVGDISLAEVDGRPAVAYYHTDPNRDLKFAINAVADGSGVWNTGTVFTTNDVGKYCSLAVVDGRPAISYYDQTGFTLEFTINAAGDGSGSWIRYTVDAASPSGAFTSLAVVDGRPAISYHGTSGDLKFAINLVADGSGVWNTYAVDGSSQQCTSLAVMPDGKPAVSYYVQSTGDLKFAYCPDVAGAPGTWNIYTVDSAGDAGTANALAVVDGRPAISYAYYNGANYDPKFAICATADGSGAWSTLTVDTGGMNACATLAVMPVGRPAIAYYSVSPDYDLMFAVSDTIDGLGTWTTNTVRSAGRVGRPALAVVNGRPVIACGNVPPSGGVYGFMFLISP